MNDPTTPLSYYRLPRGRHGLSPELVAENQRWRLLGACAEAVAEQGYAQTTSADIARRAGVSSSAFYKQFANLAECAVAAYELAADCACEAIERACAAELEEGRALRPAIDAALEFVLLEPALARLLGPAAPWDLPAVVQARSQFVDRLATPGLPERYLVAGALALLAQRLAADRTEHLPELAPELAELLASATRSRSSGVIPSRSAGPR
jgi:AcrR family transcriptional regulator